MELARSSCFWENRFKRMSCPVWNNWFCRPETAFPPQATRACCLQRARDTVKLKAACAWVVAHRGHAQCDGRNQNCGRKSFEGAKIRPREELEENLQTVLILGVIGFEKLVSKINRRLVNVKLLVQAATLEANHEAIVVARTVQIIITDVRMPKSAADRLLCSIREKAHRLPNSRHNALPEIKTANLATLCNCDVKICKAIIVIKAKPLETYLYCFALKADICGGLHDA